RPGGFCPSMRIANVEALHLSIPVVREVADGTQDVLLVRVTTDEGIVGLGEVVSSSYIGRAIIEAPKSAPRRHGLAAVLIGKDPLDPVARWHDMYEASRWYGRAGAALHVISGIDTALWDIVGRAQGKSVADVWGRKRDKVRAYASVLFPETAAEAAALTERMLAKGVTAIKYGWGPFGRERARDLALMTAIRRTAGDDVEIMVDAGRIWDAATAIDRGNELFERFNITWLEEPLHDEDFDGYRVLAAAAKGRIAGGEAEDTFAAFAKLLDNGVHVVQPDVGRAGGLTICRRVSEAAAAHKAWAVPHCFGTGVNLVASIQWMGAAADAPFNEYPFTDSPLRNELIAGVPDPVDGMIPIPDAPGLGIELNESVVQRYRVA
ncbi:MAG TPA: mandelate racemase/muconate lactonizing enzyme family protein, partial [Bauldia sp.]|nr:mandelate racemase/muconate lactonizing enzyme family protein [Bauldia sp.]